MHYVLASGSPRRKELLHRIVDDFDVIPATGEENPVSEEPDKIVEELSFQKASEIFNRIFTDGGSNDIVIGSDTVVSYNHRVLGKPADKDDATRMIGMLSGNTHEVYTGVTVFYVKNGSPESFTFSEKTSVRVADMSSEEIAEYVESGEPDDKAGAYAVQGLFAKYIYGIDGDYYNVMGLPVARLYHELKKHKLL